MRSGKPRFVAGTPGCSGPRSRDPSSRLSGECEICVVGSFVFAIFRRLALHLQPRAEPTPVETVAPPSIFTRRAKMRTPTATCEAGCERAITARAQLYSSAKRCGRASTVRRPFPHLYLMRNSLSISLFWSLFRMSSRLSKSFFPRAIPSSHFTIPRRR